MSKSLQRHGDIETIMNWYRTDGEKQRFDPSFVLDLQKQVERRGINSVTPSQSKALQNILKKWVFK